MIGGLGLSLLASPVADAALGRAGGAEVTFKAATTPAGSVQGKTSQLTVDEVEEQGKTLVRFVVPLTNIDTGIGLRDRHTREYLEVAKHPNAELLVERAAIKFPADGGQSSGQATGTLKLHGEAKPVTVSYQARRSGAAYDISGEFKVNIKDFGIKVPSYLGVTVKPDVSVKLERARVFD